MTPPRSLDAVRRDDELLDRLGSRTAEPSDAQPGDAAVRLLAALASDVDRDLPTDVDALAVQALAAAVAAHGGRDATGSSGSSGGSAVAVVAELPRRRRVVAVRRGGAVVAGLALALSSAGVAAAVTGDPAGAFGLRALSAVVHAVAHRHATRDAERELQQRIDAAAARPVVDPAALAALEAQARRLPDQGGAGVQKALAALRDRLARQGLASAPASPGATGSSGAKASGGAKASPSRPGPSARPTQVPTSAPARQPARSPQPTRSPQRAQVTPAASSRPAHSARAARSAPVTAQSVRSPVGDRSAGGTAAHG